MATTATPARADHLAWCKDRALEYLDRGDRSLAVTSMISDLGKHPETREAGMVELSAMLLAGGFLPTDDAVRHWIEGFH